MLKVVPTGAALGAEITGVDLSLPMDDETFTLVEDAFNKHGVIFFRSQTLTEKQHIDFAKRFGELEFNMNTDYASSDHPEILLVSNIMEDGKFIGLADAGTTWHTDMSATATPPRSSLLYSREVPVDPNGKVLGDTLFTSAAAAYDALDESLRTRLDGRKATHDYVAKMQARDKAVGLTRKITQAHLDRSPPVRHPVFRIHPVTGRKCIYVTQGECIAIDDIEPVEGLELIAELHAHLIRSEFHYRHNWRVGDLLMWDNCTCQHIGIKDYALPQRRLMHRVTVNGAAPF
jgi:taurine dioxygenase